MAQECIRETAEENHFKLPAPFPAWFKGGKCLHEEQAPVVERVNKGLRYHLSTPQECDNAQEIFHVGSVSLDYVGFTSKLALRTVLYPCHRFLSLV